MKVVFSARLKSNIKAKLITTYPELQFHFLKDIDEAINDLLDADILVTYGEDLTTEIINQVKNLKWIMVISAGLDQMPFEAIQKKGILVTNARGIHKIPMAEYTMTMILQIARKTKQLIYNEQECIWDRTIPMTEIYGSTLGVLGAGAIGTQIAKYAKAFNMKTIGLNQSGQTVENFDEIVTLSNLDKLLRESDYIVSVLPSTPKTNGMLNKSMFAQMKKTAVFINIGRGQTVVEQDLIAALEEGKIAHAVIDVFAKEPLPKGHRLWAMEKVTITPHLSGISMQYQPRAIEIFEKNLTTFLDGGKDFVNMIDLTKGY